MYVSDAAKLFEGLGSPALVGDEVDAFRRWVNSEVLPAIFTTGGYVLNPDCIAATSVSDMDRMPLPMEAGPMLIAISEGQPALAPFDLVDGDADTGTAAPASYSADFFRRVRALGDHPAVQDLNELVDAVVMPALFADPEALGHLTAVVSAAEAEAVHLDI